MKKFLVYMLISSFLTAQACFADNTQSINAFEIPIMSVPPGGPEGGSSSKGLSDGAVTAIVLGSVFGGLAVLGGAGYYFVKNMAALTPGTVIGEGNPFSTIALNDDCLLDKLMQCPSQNKEIIRALQCLQPQNHQDSKFLIVKDTHIENKKYNTVFFELPQSVAQKPINIKITQYSAPFTMKGKMPSLDTKLLLNAKAKDVKSVKEVPTVVSKVDPNSGILEKKGQILNGGGRIASLNTYFDTGTKKSASQVYAVLVEFSQ